jgi:predicted permease
MSWQKQIRNWFRRSSLEDGLSRELADHQERRVSDLLEQGIPEAEARRQTAKELGGATQIREEVRDVWLSRWMWDFQADLRFTVRTLVLRNPVFAVTAVLSLALGIGASTAVYSLVDQIVLKPLPVRDPASLVLIDWDGEFAGGGFGSYNTMPYPLCRELQQQRFFEGVLCRAATSVQISANGEPSHTNAEIVSGNYFNVLGVAPAVGRLFSSDDEGEAGENPVVVLAHDFWMRQWNGAPDIVGKKLLVNRHPMTIIGVAAAEFRGVDVGQVPAVWIPASMAAEALPGFGGKVRERRVRWMQVLGRLRPEWTIESAQAGLQPWFKAMLEEDTRRAGFPVISAQRQQRFLASSLTLKQAPQGHSPTRRGLERPLWLLLGATAFLLSLGCLNVAGLFLARAAARSREITTRVALGASGGRLARQMLAEALLTSVAGGLAGVAVAPLIVRGLIALMSYDANSALQASIDHRVLIFAVILSLIAGMMSGLAPALQAGRRDLIDSLRARGGSGTSSTVWRNTLLRKGIVIAQVGGSLILVTGAVLFSRTLHRLVSQGPGFETSRMMTFGVDPVRAGYQAKEGGRMMRRIQEELRGTPGVLSASVFRHELLRGGSWNNPMTIQAAGGERLATETQVHLNAVTPEFFDTLGTHIVAGRRFTEAETRSNAAKVAIVNETFVRKYLGVSNPLGTMVGRGVGPDAVPDIEIVGVAADIRYRELREQSAQAFFPFDPEYSGTAHFYVRVQGTPKDAAQAIRAAVGKVDPQLPFTYLRSMGEHLNLSLAKERVLTVLSVAFGGSSLLLSLIGLYGLISFTVTQRSREIGVRLALGATRGEAVRLILNDALAIALAGVLIGLPCVWALGRLVQSQLYEIGPTDPGAIGAAAAVILITALGAAFVPAQRAARVHPAETLRLE